MSYLHLCLSLFIESYAAENQDFVYSIWKDMRRTRTTYQVESRPRPSFFERLLAMVYHIRKLILKTTTFLRAV